MGTQSYFHLVVQAKGGAETADYDQILVALIASNENAEFAFEPDGTAADCVNWSAAEQELVAFSIAYPQHEFILYRHTLDFGEYDRILIHNGRSISSAGEVVYPPLGEDRAAL